MARSSREGTRGTAGLLSAPLLWLVLFFILPVCFIAAYSVGALHLLPTDTSPVTLGAWKRFLSGDSVYLGLFWKSIRVSLTVSIVVVLMAYPVGYFLALCVKKRKYVLLLVIIAPFLTSYLLRVLAWKVILGDRGVINTALYELHLRVARPSGGLAHLQPVRGDARARLRLGAVRGAPDLRRARQPRRIVARGRRRPRRQPLERPSARDVAP